MKRHYFLFLLLAIPGTGLLAQQDHLNEPEQARTLLFADAPAEITVSIPQLEALFTQPLNRVADVLSTKEFSYQGTVQSVTAKNDNRAFTVIIRPAEDNGSFLTVSKIIGDDGGVTYNGRILSFKHGDCYELKNAGTHYTFVKRKFYDLINE